MSAYVGPPDMAQLRQVAVSAKRRSQPISLTGTCIVCQTYGTLVIWQARAEQSGRSVGVCGRCKHAGKRAALGAPRWALPGGRR